MVQSLYRKYRPQTFSDVIGQSHVEQTLRNALSSGNISHAYLFCGPRGTGKTTTARVLAKALLCTKAPTDEPDGTCDDCRAVAEGTHPDVYELDAASRTGVENVREEIISRVAFAPTRGRYKVYIIDEVHMLSVPAFNALLKTLEEPPDHVVFILCTTDPQKVPPTIISRCQRFDFHRLTTDEIGICLKGICDAEGFTYDPDAIELIAKQANGGMRDAITSLEQVAVFGNGAVRLSAAENMLGDASDDMLFDITARIASHDIAGCFEWVAGFTQGGIDIAQFARNLTAHIRNLYVVALTDSRAALPLVDDETYERLRGQVAAFDDSDRIARLLLVLGDLVSDLRSAVDARLTLEIALVRMARPDSDWTLEGLAERVERLEHAGVAYVPTAAGAPSAAYMPTTAATAADAPTTTAPAGVASPARTRGVPAADAPAAAARTADAAAPRREELSGTDARFVAAAENKRTAAAPAGAAAQNAVARREAVKSGNTEAAANAARVPEPTTSAEVQRAFRQMVADIKTRKPSMAALFGGAVPHMDAATGGMIVELPATAKFALKQLERAENVKLASQLLQASFGREVHISYRLGDAAPSSQPQASVPAARPAHAEKPATAPMAPLSAFSNDTVASAPDDEEVPLEAYGDMIPMDIDSASARSHESAATPAPSRAAAPAATRAASPTTAPAAATAAPAPSPSVGIDGRGTGPASDVPASPERPAQDDAAASELADILQASFGEGIVFEEVDDQESE